MRSLYKSIFLIIIMFTLLFSQNEKQYVQQDWGLGAIFRVATIPFTTSERTVGSFVPMMFYHSDNFWLRGIEGGYRVYTKENLELSALGRLRFFDIPKEYQNEIQANNILWGARLRYYPVNLSYVDVEVLSDWMWHSLANVRVGLDYQTPKLKLETFGELQLKSKSFNDYYYGLDINNVGGGMDWSIGFIASYQLIKNMYLFGAGKMTLLDRNVRSLDYVNRDVFGEVYFGFGFSNDRAQVRNRPIKGRPYLRLAHGWASPTDLAHIIRFNAKRDTNNNQLTSIFYGYPLTDELFGLPLEFYITSGFVWHWSSAVQQSAQEVVLAMKVYYTVPWPIRWKLGAAEGLSYVNKIPFVENAELSKKGYRPSKLLNFLDFSVDFNIGDLFGGSDLMKRWWIGYSIHHRSAIFETAQQFGRISGGSNFQTVYLQWDM